MRKHLSVLAILRGRVLAVGLPKRPPNQWEQRGEGLLQIPKIAPRVCAVEGCKKSDAMTCSVSGRTAERFCHW